MGLEIWNEDSTVLSDHGGGRCRATIKKRSIEEKQTVLLFIWTSWTTKKVLGPSVKDFVD